MQVYGSLVAQKYPTKDYPCKIGEENVLLGIANTNTYVTRCFTPVIRLNLARFFLSLKTANRNTILDMKKRCALKMSNVMNYIHSKLRGEVLREEMGYKTAHKRIVPEIEQRVREKVCGEIAPLH